MSINFQKEDEIRESFIFKFTNLMGRRYIYKNERIWWADKYKILNNILIRPYTKKPDELTIRFTANMGNQIELLDDNEETYSAPKILEKIDSFENINRDYWELTVLPEEVINFAWWIKSFYEARAEKNSDLLAEFPYKMAMIDNRDNLLEARYMWTLGAWYKVDESSKGES